MLFELEECPQLNCVSGPQRLKPTLEEALRGPARCESHCLGHANSFTGSWRRLEGCGAENEGVQAVAPWPKGTNAVASASTRFQLPRKSQRSGRCPWHRDSATACGGVQDPVRVTSGVP